MSDHDRMIEDALRSEERDLLRSFGEEPGYFRQLASIFQGNTGWMSALMMVVVTVMFAAGIWTGWKFFMAGDALAALQWGLPTVTLILMSLVIKMAMWPIIHINALMRELKHIELQLALARKA